MQFAPPPDFSNIFNFFVKLAAKHFVLIATCPLCKMQNNYIAGNRTWLYRLPQSKIIMYSFYLAYCYRVKH
jgi:hypothetical protein